MSEYLIALNADDTVLTTASDIKRREARAAIKALKTLLDYELTLDQLRVVTSGRVNMHIAKLEKRLQ